MRRAVIVLVIVGAGVLGWKILSGGGDEEPTPSEGAPALSAGIDSGSDARIDTPADADAPGGGAGASIEEEGRGENLAFPGAAEGLGGPEGSGTAPDRSNGATAEPRAYETSPREPDAGSDPMTAAAAAAESGESLAAARLLTTAYVQARGTPQEVEALRRLEPLVREMFFSTRDVPGTCSFVTVDRGDTLDRIARRLLDERGIHVAPGLIMRTNGITDARKIRVGMRLKVVEEPLRIEVHKRLHRLEAYLGDVLVKTYDVGLGRNDSTPVGSFVIATRQVEPIWIHEGERIPFGDPRNVLGTRWLGFENTPELRGYGIHGTWEPETIGKDESEGCVRMRNADVEELFDIVPRGTPAVIHP